MIKYNLRENRHKNHHLDGRYGTIITNTVYANYPVTIVDNHDEVVNGKYTGNPALCLLHLSEDVRIYIQLKLFDEFLYLSFSFQESTFKMYEYKKEDLTNEDIVKSLKKVLYLLQPTLQRHSLVGTTKEGTENDPNYYEGQYVLNNEEEYTILKCGAAYKFFKGKKSYYPNWNDSEDLIFTGEIDFDIYKISLEVSRLKAHIVTKTNQLLEDENDGSIQQYRALKNKLEELIK